jgi:hypothetical protein
MAVSQSPAHTRGSSTVERRTWSSISIGPGMILGALGTAGVIVSLFLPWRESSVYPSDIPVEFLWDRGATGSPSLLILLIPLAVVLGIGVFVPMGSALRLIGAIGVLVVAGVFAYQLHRTTDALGGDLGDALDTGFYFAAVGGIIAFVSGFFPTGWGARRDVVRRDVEADTDDYAYDRVS